MAGGAGTACPNHLARPWWSSSLLSLPLPVNAAASKSPGDGPAADDAAADDVGICGDSGAGVTPPPAWELTE